MYVLFPPTREPVLIVCVDDVGDWFSSEDHCVMPTNSLLPLSCDVDVPRSAPLLTSPVTSLVTCSQSSMSSRSDESFPTGNVSLFLVGSNLQAPYHYYLSNDLERRPTDKEVFPSLVRHCGIRCRSLFVTQL